MCGSGDLNPDQSVDRLYHRNDCFVYALRKGRPPFYNHQKVRIRFADIWLSRAPFCRYFAFFLPAFVHVEFNICHSLDTSSSCISLLVYRLRRVLSYCVQSVSMFVHYA